MAETPNHLKRDLQQVRVKRGKTNIQLNIWCRKCQEDKLSKQLVERAQPRERRTGHPLLCLYIDSTKQLKETINQNMEKLIPLLSFLEHKNGESTNSLKG